MSTLSSSESGCLARFCGNLIFFVFTCVANSMVTISLLYMLLVSGAITASDLSALFFIELAFCATLLMFIGLAKEVNHCYTVRGPRPEILQPITVEEIF